MDQTWAKMGSRLVVNWAEITVRMVEAGVGSFPRVHQARLGSH